MTNHNTIKLSFPDNNCPALQHYNVYIASKKDGTESDIPIFKLPTMILYIYKHAYEWDSIQSFEKNWCWREMKPGEEVTISFKG